MTVPASAVVAAIVVAILLLLVLLVLVLVLVVVVVVVVAVVPSDGVKTRTFPFCFPTVTDSIMYFFYIKKTCFQHIHGSGWDGRGWGGMLTFICTCTRGDRYAWIRVGWEGVGWDVDVHLYLHTR